MKRILVTSVLRPVTAVVLTAGLLGGGMLAGTAAAATSHPSTHAGSRLACPGISFTVLHNDRSGGVILPAGRYRVWSPELGCKTASNYFTVFLNRHQGTIPGWTGRQLGKGYGVYTQNRTSAAFAVQRV
jgi:hypothetical protein